MAGDTLNVFGTLVPNAVGFKCKDSNGVMQTYGKGGGPTPAPTPWVRPADWPDLSQMDISTGDIIYMTSYADEARGFCSFKVSCTGSYTVEVGSISGSTFTADSTHTYSSGSICELYYGSANGTYKVLRVTGESIISFSFSSNNVTEIDGNYLYIGSQGVIDVVGKLQSCTSISFPTVGNVVNVKLDDITFGSSMSGIFNSCRSLISVDVSKWNTSNVTNFGSMFNGCYSLTSLDLSKWDTSKVTSMANMFYGCNSLASLDVSEWDTSSVTSMQSMFGGCNSLTSLDVSEWDTSKVTSMSSMFSDCRSLITIDVGEWDTSKVTGMSSMFSNCNSLTSLDVSEWDTSKATSMGNMFSSCYSLTSLDVSEWNTSEVTNFGNMFSDCRSLITIDVGEWDTSKVTGMSYMFSNCDSLTSLDVSEWDTSKVTSMTSMFSSCNALQSLDVSGWDTSKVTYMSSMFYSCFSLTSLDLSEWDFSNIISSSYNNNNLLSSCVSLYKSITLPSTMMYIGSSCFSSTRSIYEYHFLATTPPSLANTNAFSNMTDFGGKKIYVPYSADHSILNAYKTATNWSTWASYIEEEPQ